MDAILQTHVCLIFFDCHVTLLLQQLFQSPTILFMTVTQNKSGSQLQNEITFDRNISQAGSSIRYLDLVRWTRSQVTFQGNGGWKYT